MKRKVSIWMTAVACALAAFGLGGCGNAKTQIKISGSSSVSPLMQQLAAAYEKENADIEIVITTSDSGTGIADTEAGKNEIGMVSRDLKAAESGVTATKLCDDGVVLVVHKDSALDDVTGAAVYALYAEGTAIGSVTSAVSRESGSGTRDAFDGLIKNGGGDALSKLTELAAVVSIQNSTGAVKTQIAGSPARLGYISLGSLDDTVKALKFEGTAATAGNVQNGTYKLSRPFNLIVKKGAEPSGAAQAFIDFILSETGQTIVTDNGYVRLAA
ncbi:MAG: phosphate ABC transporter substrate-binding protein [Clostridiales bacterium]|jgi:phosphate transport system substrate-binding protein|nr:phosphate ABC transporter substrate-binding protein [Clostridiales bacterium]